MHDIFISHASEDKEQVVLPLARALDAAAITYWLDAAEIGWGDSIFQKVNSGLTASRFFLVLISDAFMKKNWTEAELAAAFAAEMRSEKSYILPVLCTDPARVLLRYPLLGARKYLTLPAELTNLALEIAKLLGRDYKERWTHTHDRHYSGEVHVTVLKHPSYLHESCTLYVEWGRLRRRVKLDSNVTQAVSLLHAKGNDGLSVPLFLKASRPVFALFGIGQGMAAKKVDINSWWLPTKLT